MRILRSPLYPPRGVRMSPPLVSITVANTTTNVFTRSTNLLHFYIVKIMAVNRTPNSLIFLRLGDGNFNQRLPDIDLPRESTVVLTADEIPFHDFTADLVAQASAAGAAPNDVQLKVEVEAW